MIDCLTWDLLFSSSDVLIVIGTGLRAIRNLSVGRELGNPEYANKCEKLTHQNQPPIDSTKNALQS